ncbi:MAG TPA: hypothetical protein DC057_10165 [Spirochaetia bacterium]|nr:hypothetical protein [Spirochaetia bacterium]
MELAITQIIPSDYENEKKLTEIREYIIREISTKFTNRIIHEILNDKSCLIKTETNLNKVIEHYKIHVFSPEQLNCLVKKITYNEYRKVPIIL